MEFLEEKENNSEFDVKRYLLKLLGSYRWIIAAVLLFLASAKLYLRYQVSQYQVSTNILINAVQLQADATNVLSGSGLLGGSSANNNANINNEIFIFQSSALMEKVIDSLNLDVSVTSYGLIKNQPINLDSLPFKIEVNKSYPRRESPLYKLTLLKAYYILEDEKNKIKGLYDRHIIVNGDTLYIKLYKPLTVKNNI